MAEPGRQTSQQTWFGGIGVHDVEAVATQHKQQFRQGGGVQRRDGMPQEAQRNVFVAPLAHGIDQIPAGGACHVNLKFVTWQAIQKVQAEILNT